MKEMKGFDLFPQTNHYEALYILERKAWLMGYNDDYNLLVMGQQIPQVNNPPVPLQRKDQFESKCIQRIKETPFIDAELYSSDPLIFIDPLGPRLLHLIQPRIGTKQLFPAE